MCSMAVVNYSVEKRSVHDKKQEGKMRGETPAPLRSGGHARAEILESEAQAFVEADAWLPAT